MSKVIKLIICSIAIGLFVFSPFVKSSEAGYEEIEKENALLVNFYRDPQPDKISNALEHISTSNFIKTSPTDVSAMTAYLFGRIAKQNSKLISKYLEIFEKNSQTHEGRVFILMVLQICGDQDTRHFLENKLNDKNFQSVKQDIQNVLSGDIPIKFDPLKREIKDGADLDFLWAEFFITGEKEPIGKIIDHLDRV